AAGRGAELGVLVKSAEALETLAGVDMMVFDKTGTLTLGRPTLTDVIPAPGVAEDDVLAFAAAAEQGSEHPIGDASVAGAKARARPGSIACWRRSCPRTRRARSRGCENPAGAWRWWATASTMRRPWRGPMSASPWARAPTSRSRRPT